jgi:cystathionine beta-lyase
VLLGSVITRDAALHLKIKLCHMRLGLGVAANDAETVLRSLPSIDLRYRAHDKTARALANWWQGQPQCAQLLHPAFEGAPGHAHWRALCERSPGTGLAAGLFSVMIDARYSQAQVDAFCDGLKLFRIGYSWGGPVSLVVPYDIAAMRQAWPDHLKPGTLVRFSTGLECPQDLILDLHQAAQAHLPTA